jgi:subtilisin family serine protease
MKPGVSFRLKVFVVIAVTLSVGLTSVAEAQDTRWIVTYLPGTNLGTQELLFKLVGIKVIHTLSFIDALAIELPLGSTLVDLLAFLVGKPVEGVFADPISVLGPISTIAQGQTPQNEVYDWGQNKIHTPDAHGNMAAGQGPGAGVIIAVLDTGTDYNHPDLSQNVILKHNVRPGGGSPADDNGHGTHIAGIIAASTNGQGVIGVAPAASLVSVKVLDHHGKCHLSDFIKGLMYVFTKVTQDNLPIKVVNMSLGFCADREPMKRAIERIYEIGVIMVAAAGNRLSQGGGAEEGGGSEGVGTSVCGDTVRYPAGYDDWVIAVAASDEDDHITDYSLPGPQVDITAPGGAQTSEQILSTKPGGSYGEGSGTSQAAAHVTGGVALALQHEPELSFEQVRDLLQSTAFKLPCCGEEQQGAGLLNVKDMLEALE